MSNGNTDALIRYRLEQAEDALQSSLVLLNQQLYRDSVNRSYYAMFYAVLALLITKQLSTSKHQAAISLFDREFIRDGIFSRELSFWLHNAFEKRLEADYRELISISDEEAKRVRERAEDFVSQVKNYLGGTSGNP